jgi:hypothetical protein
MSEPNMNDGGDAETPEPKSTTDGPERKARERVYSQYPLPSDRAAFEVHFEIVRRFATLGRNGEGIEASRVEGDPVPSQAGQMNARYLRSIGFLTVKERARYVPTPEAIRFVSARSVSDQAAAPILAEMLRKTWIGEVAQAVLSAKPGMPEEEFLGELALAAQTDKSKRQNALEVVLHYLLYAGIVLRDEQGRLSLAGPASPPSGTGVFAATAGVLPPTPVAVVGQSPGAGLWHTVQMDSFALRVRMDAEGLDDLEAYLARLKVKLERATKTGQLPAGPGNGALPPG